jgi:hypothetical protein
METNKFLKEFAIQDYITLGYLYLVILGVVNIVIYYTGFNINIFDYIAITDILLAPINMLFLNYKETAVIIIVIWIISYLLKFVFLGINKLTEKIADEFSKPLKKIVYQPMIVFIILFSYKFLVLSMDMAHRVSSKVKNKTYKLDTTLTFVDNTKKDVCVIATTSMYLFYVEKGEDVVTIVPIVGNVRAVKEIKN